MQVFNPENIPLVVVESMNSTHKEEVELVNGLAAEIVAAQNGSENDLALSQRLQDWVAHTREHFLRENQLMERFGFPAYTMHCGEHDRVLQLIIALHQTWLQQRDVAPLADFILREWSQWFEMHVNSMDRVTAEFLARQGLTA
jgi:hemerythrin